MVKFYFQGEAGEKKEGDLEEVKIDIETEDDEKKDAEKPEPPYSKYLNQLKEGGNACQLKYNALERRVLICDLWALFWPFLALFETGTQCLSTNV